LIGVESINLACTSIPDPRMKMKRKNLAVSRLKSASLLCILALTPLGWSQSVSLHVHVAREQTRANQAPPSSADVVVWLTPTPRIAFSPRTNQQYTLIQKDKQFSPHILVVPTGSSVEFPNLDPFFHNVFSLFNGKRFDLGLYEAHTQRSVLFDREGVSYIFCNIHPEMGAVIISLSTPYYGISSADGAVAMHGVPPGHYRLHVWAENVPADRLAALSRVVETSGPNTDLGSLAIEITGNLMQHHQNKFGEPYTPDPKPPY
jgi:plastocyanin